MTTEELKNLILSKKKEGKIVLNNNQKEEPL